MATVIQAPPRPRLRSQKSIIDRPVKLWTAEELFALPAENNRYELVRGELVPMTPTTVLHGKLLIRVGHFITEFVDKHDLGEIYGGDPGFVLASDPDVVRAPDVAFVQKERIKDVPETGFWAIAPDLVVEIISPSESAGMIHDKVTDYLAAGVRLVWLVYPRSQTAQVYRSFTQSRLLTPADSLEGEDVLPGFSLPLKDLFK